MDNEKLIKKLEKWNTQLGQDGCNTKLMVKNDIQALIETLKQENNENTKQA